MAAVVVTSAAAVVAVAFINGPGQKALQLRSQVESELSFYFSLPAKGKTQHTCTHTTHTYTHKHALHQDWQVSINLISDSAKMLNTLANIMCR